MCQLRPQAKLGYQQRFAVLALPALHGTLLLRGTARDHLRTVPEDVGANSTETCKAIWFLAQAVFMTPIQTAILRAIQSATEPPNAISIQSASDTTMAARATVYKVLARMTERGLVRKLPALKGTHNGPPRPRYDLTAKGKKVLEGMAH